MPKSCFCPLGGCCVRVDSVWPKAYDHRSLGQRPRTGAPHGSFGRRPYSPGRMRHAEYGLRPKRFLSSLLPGAVPQAAVKMAFGQETSHDVGGANRGGVGKCDLMIGTQFIRNPVWCQHFAAQTRWHWEHARGDDTSRERTAIGSGVMANRMSANVKLPCQSRVSPASNGPRLEELTVIVISVPRILPKCRRPK